MLSPSVRFAELHAFFPELAVLIKRSALPRID